MYKYLEKEGELNFHKIFNEVLGKYACTYVFQNISNYIKLFSGYLLFKDFCENDSEEPIQQLKFFEQVRYLFHI